MCVMIMGQMREEGLSRPLCFEDSPPPLGPVQLHRSDLPQNQETGQIKEGLPLCAHAYVLISDIFFPELLASTSNQTVVISVTKTCQTAQITTHL